MRYDELLEYNEACDAYKLLQIGPIFRDVPPKDDHIHIRRGPYAIKLSRCGA